MDSVDFDALEAAAQAKMSPGAFAFLQGGADDEITVRENVAAWRARRLRPRVLRDISTVTTATTILRARVAMPIMVAPSGRQKIFYPDGADGVHAVLEHLRTELIRATALVGVTKPDEATADLVASPRRI